MVRILGVIIIIIVIIVSIIIIIIIITIMILLLIIINISIYLSIMDAGGACVGAGGSWASALVADKP